ncbi:MAG: NAD-dependent protein deacylase [Candidatus Eisenbacteria bacterium]|nr:NAD-dependent protein deacylase [Candidatus Eisenbacteria bacterium]
MRPETALPGELSREIRGLQSVGAITGAGVSKESGIPTYRGKGGLYDDPEKGDQTVDALTATTLAVDPDRTWRVIAELARQSLTAKPNAAHHALVKIEKNVTRFILLTQNVDGLHQLAGTRNIIDIHGNTFDTVCLGCDTRGHLDRSTLTSITRTPVCNSCGGHLRPDVVLFGEILPRDKVEQMRNFYINPPDLLVIAGTSALFPYILEPIFIARAAGKITVEINPEPTKLSDQVDYSLRGPAGVYLPALAEALLK